MNWSYFYNLLINNTSLQVLCIVIVLDIIFGILRAIKEKSINSCIGIDGMIRKVGMLLTIVFLIFIDILVNIDFIAFIPETAKEILNLEKIGISNVFIILFVVFEILSIFKNMVLCEMPIPKKLQNFLEKVMKEFTSEIKENNESEEK